MAATDRPLGRRALGGTSVAVRGRSVSPISAAYTPGTYTFTARAGGFYRFVLRGHGGAGGPSNSNAGGSGAYVEAIRLLGAGQTAAIVVAPGSSTGSAGSTDTTVTLPNGEVLSAGGGFAQANSGTGGVPVGKASLGDILISGSTGVIGAGNPGVAGLGPAGGAGGAVGGGRAGGTGAPGTLQYPGAAGPTGDTAPISTGAGAAASGGLTINLPGGPGEVLVMQVRLKP